MDLTWLMNWPQLLYEAGYAASGEIYLLLSFRAGQKKKRNFPRGAIAGRTPVLLFGLGITILLTVYFFFQPGLLDLANNRIYDALLVSIPHKTPSDLPVIVDIDDESLKQFGQWPWPRYQMAKLLKKINALSPKCIALDMFFSEPDRTSFEYLRAQIARDFNIQINSENLPDDVSHDALLAQTLATGPFVLGYNFTFNPISSSVSSSPVSLSKAACRIHPAPVYIQGPAHASAMHHFLLESNGIVCNLERLSNAVTHSGFVNAQTDRDGALRRVPLLMAYDTNIYPSLATAAILKAMGTKQLVLRTNAAGVESLILNNRVIPLDEKGQMLIRFRGPENTFPHISAIKFMNDQVPSEELMGRIVFIGTSAAGLRDFHATPFDHLYPGVEAHAAIVDNVIQGDFLSRPQWMRGIELIAGVLVGILSALLLAYGRAVWTISIFVISVILFWGGAERVLSSYGLFVSPFIPVAIFAINFAFLSAGKFWWAERIGKKRAQELAMVQAVTLETLAMVIETRHTETGGHVKRTQHYVKQLAKWLQKNKKYRHLLNDETIELLFRSSPLHDVGKVGVPDSILKNPGKLTPDEFETMKNHTVYGKEIFDEAEAKLGHNSFLSIARTIAYTHHEKWDGSGYPRGLQGEAIPLYGRIMTIADIYDALISQRIYKAAMSHESAAKFIRKISGTELDPSIVDAFINCQDHFKAIADQYTDDSERELTLVNH